MKNKNQVGILIVLSESIRELLKLMHFRDIPEEAEAIIFYENGDVETVDRFFGGVSDMRLTNVAYYPVY